jgi:hypothetical protein
VKEWRWLTSAWGKAVKRGGNFSRPVAFIPQRRERECVVPHVDDRTATSSWTIGARRALGFPLSESLIGGPRLTFERWRESEAVSGRTVPRPDLLNLISYFSKLK